MTVDSFPVVIEGESRQTRVIQCLIFEFIGSSRRSRWFTDAGQCRWRSQQRRTIVTQPPSPLMPHVVELAIAPAGTC